MTHADEFRRSCSSGGAGVVTRQLIVDRHFDLGAILDGTQDFRWGDGWHSGMLSGNLIHIRQIDRRVEYRAGSELDGLPEVLFPVGGRY